MRGDGVVPCSAPPWPRRGAFPLLLSRKSRGFGWVRKKREAGMTRLWEGGGSMPRTPRTRQPPVVAADEIAALIEDGMTIASEGFTMMGVAEELYAAIEQRFLATGRPRDLTWFHAAGQSDRVHGLEHLAHPGLLRRIIGTHWGLAPRMSALIAAEELEAFCLPQGQVSHLFRASAAGEPGVITPIGLHTFLDPRQD